MNNPPKKPSQPSQPSQPPKQGNPAVDELVALRQEISELRKDFAKFSKELSLKVAFGIIGSFVLVQAVIQILSLVFGYG
ncbi:hypothetical protein ACSQ6I_23425 [Anabaena sp. WFMT]|uniref:hypothetical protein n=1 Tax=Anabaena sp. WFMT TaxID=3449730 RepID=UPI003F1F8D5B